MQVTPGKLNRFQPISSPINTCGGASAACAEMNRRVLNLSSPRAYNLLFLTTLWSFAISKLQGALPPTAYVIPSKHWRASGPLPMKPPWGCWAPPLSPSATSLAWTGRLSSSPEVAMLKICSQSKLTSGRQCWSRQRNNLAACEAQPGANLPRCSHRKQSACCDQGHPGSIAFPCRHTICLT